MLRVCWLGLLVAGCGAKDGAGGGDTSDTSDDSGGGGGVTWRPSGEGYGFFIDGARENSTFRLELTRVTAPDDGQAYYGWLSRGGASAISLGEIPVDGDTVAFEAELDLDALSGGYDTFRAVQAPAGTPASEGDGVWEGAIDPTLLANIGDLLLASSATRTGSGLLRSLDGELAILSAYATATTTGSYTEAEYHDRAEAIYNALSGENADLDNDGDKETMDDAGPLDGDAGLVDAVYAGLDAISGGVQPGDPIKDFANYAYDCTRRGEDRFRFVLASAGVGAVCASASSCQSAFTNMAYDLDIARTGVDADESGAIDLITEATLPCAVYYVSQMARMDVGPS